MANKDHFFEKHQFYYKTSNAYSIMIDVVFDLVLGAKADQIASVIGMLNDAWELLDDDQRLCLWKNKPDIVKNIKSVDIDELDMYTLIDL